MHPQPQMIDKCLNGNIFLNGSDVIDAEIYEMALEIYSSRRRISRLQYELNHIRKENHALKRELADVKQCGCKWSDVCEVVGGCKCRFNA